MASEVEKNGINNGTIDWKSTEPNESMTEYYFIIDCVKTVNTKIKSCGRLKSDIFTIK